jgi:hypothetical protein
MFPPTVRKSKFSYTSSEILYFYDLEKPGTFGVPNRILRDIRAELFKTHKTRTVPGKVGRMESLRVCNLLYHGNPISKRTTVTDYQPQGCQDSLRSTTTGEDLTLGVCFISVTKEVQFKVDGYTEVITIKM